MWLVDGQMSSGRTAFLNGEDRSLCRCAQVDEKERKEKNGARSDPPKIERERERKGREERREKSKRSKYL